MEDGDRIGRVVAQGEGRWEWIIRDFPELPRREDAFFYSPEFNAEGGGWHLRIDPNGWRGETQIHIWLRRQSFRTGPSVSCTVGVKRADHQEEMGTKNCSEYATPYPFKRTRRELEEEAGVWLPGGRLTLTLTLHFGRPKVHKPSIPRDIRPEQLARAIDQDSRRDVSQPPEAKAKVCSRETQTDVEDGRHCTHCTAAKANIKVSSRESQTDGRIDNDQRPGDCTSVEAKGVKELSEHLKGLLAEGHKNYDVTLLVKGKEFRAHRCILEARSPVLGMMLRHDSKEKKSGTIDIPDCDPDCFEAFLLFLYSGRAENLDTSQALGLYYAADKYDLPLLKEQCVQFLEASLSVTSVCDVVLLAARHGEEELLETATEYFVKNLQTILFTVEWQKFMAKNPTVANELYIKSLQNLGHLT